MRRRDGAEANAPSTDPSELVSSGQAAGGATMPPPIIWAEARLSEARNAVKRIMLRPWRA
jgi:hypothetical protein